MAHVSSVSHVSSTFMLIKFQDINVKSTVWKLYWQFFFLHQEIATHFDFLFNGATLLACVELRYYTYIFFAFIPLTNDSKTSLKVVIILKAFSISKCFCFFFYSIATSSMENLKFDTRDSDWNELCECVCVSFYALQ